MSHVMPHMTYLEAAVVGLIQGVTELFPVSSLGHNVLLPALIGGNWATDLNVAAPESPYLAFIVGLHVATAIALLIYFWRDWVRIIRGFLTSIRDREAKTVDQKMAWMIILATIPVGLVGLKFEHEFRVLFGKPVRNRSPAYRISPLMIRKIAARTGLPNSTRNSCSNATPTSPTGIVARMIIQAIFWSTVLISRSRIELKKPPMIRTQSRQK